MRLTNVAQLRLPFGKLHGYDVAVQRTGVELPISFDQRRHVSLGQRPGSWMAISFRLPAKVQLDVLASAWLEVINRHGTLCSAFSQDEHGELRLEEIAVAPGAWVQHPVASGQSMNDALRDVFDKACSPFNAPSHRLCLLETALESTVVIASDHSHVDMWSMLVVVRDLLRSLGLSDDDVVPQPLTAASFTEHTRALAERERAPREVHQRWAEVLDASGSVMPRFPLPLGEPVPHAERVEVRDVLDVDDSAAFAAQAKEDSVSTLTAVISAMTSVTLDLAQAPLRAVFPVHSRYDHQWDDSVGWFITNSVIESADPAPTACAAAVKEAVRLGSWPLEEILDPWGGMPEAPGMFAISWLDLRRLPVRVDSIGLEAQYIGATIRTDGVMLWFILDDAGLHLRCRYPDTPEGREHVGGWLDALILKLRAQARASVGGLLRLGERRYRVQRAERSDVPAIVALLSDDELGASREGDELVAYERAFDKLSRDWSNYLAVVRDEEDAVVGTMQLSIIPGLSRKGTTRLQIEGVRVAASERSHGVGRAMLEWAHAHGRARGARLAQLTTDTSRLRAHEFYARLGYEKSHVGLKLQL
ncbi:GNAT family N-acetyltransferase [Glutamicibacter mishrai]|uniref:GNAT family N-acetyltransferase n=1 Tax=Glutamicibacter mishrai TaxID=1775880 RepID=A0A6H0SH77_9MICC|nr:GNAT family N-acetyltransferase [Glutamicibacter mishrai]QIV87012.1 GNAT family N-acetyltransferase [Glutamicibacter mishrai]